MNSLIPRLDIKPEKDLRMSLTPLSQVAVRSNERIIL
jgi:hypothetical protein